VWPPPCEEAKPPEGWLGRKAKTVRETLTYAQCFKQYFKQCFKQDRLKVPPERTA